MKIKEIKPKERKFKFIRKSATGKKSTVVSIPESKLTAQQEDELYMDFLKHHDALPMKLQGRFLLAVMENLKEQLTEKVVKEPVDKMVPNQIGKA